MILPTSSSDAEMANLFNNYFSSVFTDEDAASLPVVDLTGTTLIPNSIEFTP